MRFLHTADWQLGMTRWFLAGDAQPRYSAARRESVARIGELAVDAGAEFVVVAGDVFEDNQLDPDVVSRSLEAMRSIPVSVYLLPGNHDPLDAASLYRSELFTTECPDNVVVLTEGGPHVVRSGVEIVAAPWTSKRPRVGLAAEALAGLGPADEGVRIMVAHGGVDVLDPDPANPALISLAGLQDAVGRGVVHYVALGDKHSLTSIGESGRIWYSGSPEVTNFDDIEPDSGNVLVVDIDDAAPTHPVNVQARHIGQWRFHTLRGNVDTAGEINALARDLDNRANKDRTAIRTALTGSLSISDRAALDGCLDKYSRLFAWLGPWERHTDLMVIPADNEFGGLGLGGFATAAVDELMDTAQAGGEAADDAQAALALLLRLAAHQRSAA